MQLALLLGLLLVAAPVARVRADEESDEYEDEDAQPLGQPIDLDANVLTGTEKNFDELVAKHAFVLVGVGSCV
jgi:hypothetical protein